MLYSFVNVLFFFFFFFFFFFPPRHDFVAAISLEPSLVETPDWVCYLVLLSILHYCLSCNSLRYFFFFFFFFFFFSAKILSGPYLWNRYLQRLQIECAAWSCGLILHYYLPSNSLRYFFLFFYFFFFFPPRFCPGHISGTVTRRDSKLSVLFGPAV